MFNSNLHDQHHIARVLVFLIKHDNIYSLVSFKQNCIPLPAWYPGAFYLRKIMKESRQIYIDWVRARKGAWGGQ